MRPFSTRSVPLVRHPYTPCDAVVRIDAGVRRTEHGALELVYRIEGDLHAVAVPAPRAAVRESGLWHHTCLEAFIAGPGTSYREFNLAPSGAWAIYDFTSYREGMTPSSGGPAPPPPATTPAPGWSRAATTP